MLNTRNGGAVGNVCVKYSYDEILALARSSEATYKKEFYRKHNPVYQFADKNGLLDRLAADMGWPDHAQNYWTKETCVEKARPYKWLSDWVKKDRDSYMAAHRNGWLKEIKQRFFRHKPPQVTWIREKCLQRAKDFKSRSEWQYRCKDGSYISARKRRWLNDIAKETYNDTPDTRWVNMPDEAIIAEAQKYAFRNQWKWEGNLHYQHVYRMRRHLIPQCTAHMQYQKHASSSIGNPAVTPSI